MGRKGETPQKAAAVKGSTLQCKDPAAFYNIIKLFSTWILYIQLKNLSKHCCYFCTCY